jgi:hypothetical protein
MHDPAMEETSKTAFGKDFGGMAQRDKKMGQQGTNPIFVMTHDNITRISKHQTATCPCGGGLLSAKSRPAPHLNHRQG